MNPVRRLGPLACLASIALVSAGCATAASPSAAYLSASSPAGAASSSPPAPTPAATPELTQRVDAGTLVLELPAGWHVRRGLPNPGGVFATLYAGPAAIPDNCAGTAGGGGVCQAWPRLRLDPGGMVVAVVLHGMPRLQPPSGGTPATLAGQPARRIAGPADAACRAIGGSQSIVVAQIPPSGSWTWSSIEACVAGGSTDAGLAADDAAFDAIVTSATLVAAGPSPSEGQSGPLPD